MKFLKNLYLRLGIAALLGAVLGFAYYYYIGCATGTCPITSNPYISTIYGGIMGILFAFPGKKKKKEQDDQQNDNN